MTNFRHSTSGTEHNGEPCLAAECRSVIRGTASEWQLNTGLQGVRSAQERPEGAARYPSPSPPLQAAGAAHRGGARA
jgi:hypothetical protein